MSNRAYGKILATCLAAWVALHICGCAGCQMPMRDGVVVACAGDEWIVEVGGCSGRDS